MGWKEACLKRPFAVCHHPDGVVGANQPPIGRRVAGLGLLAGIAKFTRQNTLYAFTSEREHAEHFEALMNDLGWRGDIGHVDPSDRGQKDHIGTLVLPGPSLAQFAEDRSKAAIGNYALCGVTHTIATRDMAFELLRLLCAPLLPGDAIICPSQAVRDVVKAHFNLASEHGWPAGNRPPDLPVIPLGITCNDFAPKPDVRQDWRARLGLGAGDVAVLSVARLSTFEKMHPAPLFAALHQARQQTRARLHLILCGWFPDEDEKAAHRDMARAFAPDVPVTFLDGQDQDTKAGLLQAADIFFFPVDNIQETFGIASVEAMAAGLPLIVSDWNGLSETVVQGETGYKAPTYIAHDSTASGLLEAYQDGDIGYLQYLGSVQQRVAIDVRAMAEALTLLASDAEMRKKLGDAGRKRAEETYDWSVVIPQLEALWADQAERAAHASAQMSKPSLSTPSSVPNVLKLYRGYASDRLTASHVLGGAGPMTGEDMLAHIRLTGSSLPGFMPVSPNLILRANHDILRAGRLQLGDLAENLSVRYEDAEAAAIWLLKFGFVALVHQGTSQ